MSMGNPVGVCCATQNSRNSFTKTEILRILQEDCTYDMC